MPPETMTAAPSAAPAAPVTPVVAPVTPASPSAPASAPSIEQASATMKGATSWADLNIPAMAVTDGADDAPADDAPPAVEAPESVPTGDEGPEFVQNAQGQWHRPDGTFANADEVTAIEAQIAADAVGSPPAGETPAEPEKTDNIVTLRTRDGKTREVQIDDPDLAQEIRQNFNDGMRQREYNEKSAVLDARLAEFRQLETLLQTNPEAVILDSLSPEQEIRVTQALVAKHFDALLPVLQKYDTDPSSRIAATAEAQLRMREQQKTFETQRTAAQQAAAVKSAVATLIPDTLAPEIQEQFWADASMDLQRALSRGEKVDPATVPGLLQSRLKLYGIDAPAGGSAAPARVIPRIAALPAVPASGTPNAAASSPVATPANDAAHALASARAQQTRIRLTQRNRANAAAVPPVGAGAAPVRLPPVPAGATIEDASRAMKKQRSWTS